jgi:hypothetical protein
MTSGCWYDGDRRAVFADGEAALRTPLAAEGMAYAVGRCVEEYARALGAIFGLL